MPAAVQKKHRKTLGQLASLTAAFLVACSITGCQTAPQAKLPAPKPNNDLAEDPSIFRLATAKAHAPAYGIPCRYLLAKGDAREQNEVMSVDWQAHDSYTKAFTEVTDDTTAALRGGTNNTPELDALQKLLAQPSWTAEDRKAWEKNLAKVVSGRMNGEKGLETYRAPGKDVVRTMKLNDLSADIDAGTQKHEYDCQQMSFTKGCAIQTVEDRLLPSSAPAGDYKKASDYYYTIGYYYRPGGEGGHAFLVSGATMNVIESTKDKGAGNVSPYFQQAAGGYTLQDYTDGKMMGAINENGETCVYSPGYPLPTDSADMKQALTATYQTLPQPPQPQNTITIILIFR